MRHRGSIRVLVITSWVFVVIGCANTELRRGQELAVPVTKLTTAVVGVVCYSEGGSSLTSDQIVSEAMKDKPELQQAFQDLPIKVKHAGNRVVVLVCSPDGKYAWLEDASWTRGVDHEWYEVKPPQPAEFTMDPTVDEKKYP